MKNIFYKPSTEDKILKGRGVSLFEQLCPTRTLEEANKLIPSYKGHLAYQSQLLRNTIHGIFVDVFPTKSEFEKNFDLFDLTLGLKIEQHSKIQIYIGFFHFMYDKTIMSTFFSRGEAIGDQWGYLELFQGEEELTALLHSYPKPSVHMVYNQEDF